MPEYYAPGVYVEEQRADVLPIQPVGTNTAGFVGPTERGPSQAMLITSWAEFQRWYGDLLDPAQSALPLSVRGFFANGGHRVFIARVCRGDARAAARELPAEGGGSLRVQAQGPGAWGNQLYVRISKATRNNDRPSRFHLQVRYYRDQPQGSPPDFKKTAPTILEDYDELSVNPKEGRYALGAVNSTSHLISLAWQEGQPPPAALSATQDFVQLTDGDNGTESLTAKVFMGDESAPSDRKTGLAALGEIDEIAILAVPDAVNPSLLDPDQQNELKDQIIQQCEHLHDRFAVLDIPPAAGNVAGNPQFYLGRRSNYAAIYHPHLRVLDPLSKTSVLVPPSGFVAGIYAFNDETRGVHKAPANYEVRGILTDDLSPAEGPLEYVVTKGQQEILNPLGINVIRDFRATGQGIRVWGARTISNDPEWTYVNVRRLFNFVEESVEQGLQWVVFEPNSEPTWSRVIRTISTFLARVWRDGALMGTSQEEAFFVRCDRTTMTTDDLLNGRLICLVGLAAVRPAEFVVLRFSQFTAEATT